MQNVQVMKNKRDRQTWNEKRLDELSVFHRTTVSKIKPSIWVLKAYEDTHRCPDCESKLMLDRKNGERMLFVCTKCRNVYELGYKNNAELKLAYKGKEDLYA